MTDGPPRQLIDELVSRWEHAGLRLIVVEGAHDQRFFSSIQREPHCDKAMRDIDVWEVDAVDVPDALVGAHGLNDVGCKQRVIALGREISARNQSAALRGIVDMDLDKVLQLDFSSETVLYTDNACIECYLWTVKSLRHLLDVFGCDGLSFSTTKIRKLYDSINVCCREIAAFRVVSKLSPAWGLLTHRSEKTLQVQNGVTKLDLEKYVNFSKPTKGTLAAAKQKILETRDELKSTNPLVMINGHDLAWILTFTLKELSNNSRRLLDAIIIERALLEFGVMDADVSIQPMIKSVVDWIKS